MERYTYIKECSSVIVCIVDSDCSSANTNIKANSEVSWLEWHVGSILLNNYLSLQEGSLWGTTVDLLWFGNQN